MKIPVEITSNSPSNFDRYSPTEESPTFWICNQSFGLAEHRSWDVWWYNGGAKQFYYRSRIVTKERAFEIIQSEYPDYFEWILFNLDVL